MIEDISDDDAIDDPFLDSVQGYEDCVRNTKTEGIPQSGRAQTCNGVLTSIDELQDSVEGVIIGVSKRQNGGGGISGEGGAQDGGDSGEDEAVGG